MPTTTGKAALHGGEMGGDGYLESTPLLLNSNVAPPKDSFNLAYIIYFILGCGYVLPWNVFITAVDYFTYLYPTVSVDRTFSIVNMILSLICLLIIVLFGGKSNLFVRVNVGLFLYLVSLVTVPLIDYLYVKGRVGVYGGFYLTIGLVGVSGAANGLVQGGVIGSAGELPERYIQATLAGTAASGVLVSFLRILTKAVYPQDADGLRSSANLYFIVSIAMMISCIVLYNVAHRLPVIKYYRDLKTQAVKEENQEKGDLASGLWRSTLCDIVGTIKWYGLGILSIYVVTLCIFPGYITEDVHSQLLNDWYPILLITCYNVFDLVGKSLTPICFLENAIVAIGACYARLLFLPLFYGCLHGPNFFRTELPVTILTCLLGLTNGYFTSVLMMLGSKTVQLQQAEIAGTVLVLFLVLGLAIGSVVSWFWVI